MPDAARLFFVQDRRLEYGVNTWLWGVRRCEDTARFLDRAEDVGRGLTEPPWDLRAVQLTLREHPEHQLGMVLTPQSWQSPEGHFLHMGAGGGVPSYAERAVRLRECLSVHRRM